MADKKILSISAMLCLPLTTGEWGKIPRDRILRPTSLSPYRAARPSLPCWRPTREQFFYLFMLGLGNHGNLEDIALPLIPGLSYCKWACPLSQIFRKQGPLWFTFGWFHFCHYLSPRLLMRALVSFPRGQELYSHCLLWLSCSLCILVLSSLLPLSPPSCLQSSRLLATSAGCSSQLSPSPSPTYFFSCLFFLSFLWCIFFCSSLFL